MEIFFSEFNVRVTCPIEWYSWNRKLLIRETLSQARLISCLFLYLVLHNINITLLNITASPALLLTHILSELIPDRLRQTAGLGLLPLALALTTGRLLVLLATGRLLHLTLLPTL